MCISVNGEPLAVAEMGVMDFNKQGRDGFPFKAAWLEAMLKALGAKVDDFIVLRHMLTVDGVIHVSASLMPPPEKQTEQQQTEPGRKRLAAAPAPSWTASATCNYTAGCNADFPSTSCISDARQHNDDNEGEVNKKRRFDPLGDGQPLKCHWCSKEFVYRGAFIK